MNLYLVGKNWHIFANVHFYRQKICRKNLQIKKKYRAPNKPDEVSNKTSENVTRDV